MNHNILLAVADLLRVSRLKLMYEYSIDLSIAVLEFIHASINGQNINNEIAYVNFGLFNIINDAIQHAAYKRGSAYYDLDLSELTSDAVKGISNKYPFNKRMNELKFIGLNVCNGLLNKNTAYLFTNNETISILVSLMKLGFLQYKSSHGNNYITDLLRPTSNVCKDYMIEIPFLAYYLLHKSVKEFEKLNTNIVQIKDSQSRVKYYYRLLCNLAFHLN